MLEKLFILSILILNTKSTCDHENFTNLNSIDLQKCSNLIDLVLIMDTSFEATIDEFENLKLAIINFIRQLKIGADNVRIAIITSSERVNIVLNLMNGIEPAEAIVGRIININQSGMFSWMSLALNYAQVLFSLSNRTENTLIPKVAIILSNGNVPVNEMDILRREANSLKNFCHVITVGISKRQKKNILKMMASCPSYFIEPNQIYNLTSLIACNTCVLLRLDKRESFFLEKEQVRYFKIQTVNFNKEKEEIIQLSFFRKSGNLNYFYSFSKKNHQYLIQSQNSSSIEYFTLRSNNHKAKSSNTFRFYFRTSYGITNIYFNLKGIETRNSFEIIARKFSDKV